MQNALYKSCRANICSFYQFFSIYQLMALVDSSINLNKWKERVVSIKAVIISIHAFLLLSQAPTNEGAAAYQEIPQIHVSVWL